MKVMKTQAILSGLLIWVSTLLTAQIEQERILLLTDRGHYISGEFIQYSALYEGPGEGEQGAWSKILYVELVLPNGSSLRKQKVTLDQLGAKGIIGIPEGLSSGTYYLKAYTRWMRNCGPEAFSYTSIQVYDSFNESVLPVDSNGWVPTTPSNIFNQAGIPTFDTPERAVRAFVDIYRDAQNKQILQQIPSRVHSKLDFDRITAKYMIHESLKRGNHMLSEPESKKLLSLYGIPVNRIEVPGNLNPESHILP